MRVGIVGVGFVMLAAAGCAQMQVPGSDVGLSPEQPPAAEAVLPAAAAPDAASRPAESRRANAPAETLPPPTPVNLWQRVRSGFRLPNVQGPLVEEWEQWYSSRPDYVARMIERSSRFLYHVVEEVERRGMPSEIALLPMIESAYNPQAYSRSHASGMWQFIPATGKTYGLRQNFWYDGRRDPIAATSAALDYLEKLHEMFGDWALALAAYNWGEGAVSRAVARNQAKGMPADYESLTMPPETRNYVPKLQAVKNIIADPRAYGLELADIPNRPYFTTVRTDRHIDVKLAARLAEMPLEEFRFLNPAHNKPVIKAERGELIVLPLDKAEVFQRNLAAHGEPLVSWQAYTVKRSDKPERIAARHGMTLAQLKAVNTIAPNHRIAAGQTLIVPVSGDVTPNLPDLPTAALASAPAKGKARSVHVANRHAAPVKVARVSSVRKPAPHASRAPAKRSVYAARTTKKQPVGRVKVSVPGRKVALAEAGKSARQ